MAIQTTHVLLVVLPAQGQINPALQFAKKLLRMGIEVTFSTSVYANHRMSIVSGKVNGLNYAAYSDGLEDGYKFGLTDFNHYMKVMKDQGSKSVRDIILNLAKNGHPVTCLIYSLLLPWVVDLAREFHIPSTLLWVQAASIFNIYYYYFNGYEDEVSRNSDGFEWSIQLPGLPLLTRRDLPSFMVPSLRLESFSAVLETVKEHLNKLDSEENVKILVNTFDVLECEALKAMEKYSLISVGPLIPSACLDGKDPLDTSSGGDFFEKSKIDYIEWLNLKGESSVVYIAFGSMVNLPKLQMEEIAKGLLETRRPFLWVMRVKENGEEEERLSCIEELEKQGMIVPWCSQLEVLTHKSLGCFVSHCGWNSTLESLACGVPVVAFPQWTDQWMNSKMIQDVWKTGVRVRSTENGIIECDEIKKCIEMVMDGKEIGQEFRKNAQKWKGLAKESMQEGGSSDKNLKSFVEQVLS